MSCRYMGHLRQLDCLPCYSTLLFLHVFGDFDSRTRDSCERIPPRFARLLMDLLVAELAHTLLTPQHVHRASTGRLQDGLRNSGFAIRPSVIRNVADDIPLFISIPPCRRPCCLLGLPV